MRGVPLAPTQLQNEYRLQPPVLFANRGRRKGGRDAGSDVAVSDDVDPVDEAPADSFDAIEASDCGGTMPPCAVPPMVANR